MIDTGLYLSYLLVIVAVVGAAIAPVVLAVLNGDTKSLMKAGALTVGLLVLFGVCWGISGDEVTPIYENATSMITIDAGVSKSVGGGLYMFYIMFAVSIVAIIWAEVSKFFR